jgi:hypothetical protein
LFSFFSLSPFLSLSLFFFFSLSGWLAHPA